MNPFVFLYFFPTNQTETERQRQRHRPLDKPEALERSRSNGSDSGSIPDRSLSGNLDTNSLFSEFTEYLRLSLPPLLPLLLAPSIGDFRPVSSISLCVCLWLSVFSLLLCLCLYVRVCSSKLDCLCHIYNN